MKTISIDGVEYKLTPIKKESKTKALFVLSMPRIGSWNGKWSGSNKVYALVKTAFMRGKPVFPNLKEGDYGYDFGDGWFASVNVKFVTPSEARAVMKHSSGFCGYDWMCNDICINGSIRER